MENKVRRKTVYVAIAIFVTLPTLLIVFRRSAGLTIIREPFPNTKVGRHVDGNKKDLINSIPKHPPFRYNMTSTEVMYPWKDDKECSGIAVRFGEALPPIFLISFPRSGNTWLRYLLQGATGFFTGSVYYTKGVFDMGYPGEYEHHSAGTTLFIKDHLRPRTQFNPEQYSSVVLIIRNPKNAIESFISFNAGHRTIKYKGSKDDFKNIDKLFKEHLVFWEKVATLPLNNSRYLHVLTYENLKVNPIEEIRKIMKFVIMPEDPTRLACLAKHLEGPANRGQPEFEPFNAEQTAKMAAAVERVNVLMVKRGFPPLPYAEQGKTSDN